MNDSLFRRLARGTIRLANWLIDGAVLAAVVLIVCFTAFTVMDNDRVMQQADESAFETYKPAGEGASFEELQAMNPDVLGWLTLYGTGIDYPVVQGDDNEKYINTNAAGEFALSGALFLDYRNASDFSDASTIVFGHHMEDSLMFGDLDLYGDAAYAEKHATGNLFYGGVNHGVEVLGYLSTDAYDQVVYSTTVGEEPAVDEFVGYLRSKAKVWRQDPREGDRLLILSTCGKGTNDRHIVVARICDDTFEDPYPDEQVSRSLAGTAEGVRIAAQIGIGLLAFLLIAWVMGGTRSRKKGVDDGGREP
jgi:sortase B